MDDLRPVLVAGLRRSSFRRHLYPEFRHGAGAGGALGTDRRQPWQDGGGHLPPAEGTRSRPCWQPARRAVWPAAFKCAAGGILFVMMEEMRPQFRYYSFLAIKAVGSPVCHGDP